MKNSKTMAVAVAVVGVLSLAVTKARAGYLWGSTVQINAADRSVQGTLSNVRSSQDDLQFISCAVRASAGSPAFVECYARDSTGARAYCSSTEPGMVQAGSAVKTNSHIIFRWNTNGSCAYISSETSSSFAPLQP